MFVNHVSPVSTKQKLKATVPSPVLKSCLDDMVDDPFRSKNPFDESDGDDSDDDGTGGSGSAKHTINRNKKGKHSKDKVDTKDGDKLKGADPLAGSLVFKAGRNVSSSLYYTKHSVLQNGGNGLEPDQRNELSANLAKAEEEQTQLQEVVRDTEKETAKLLSEPTNEALNHLLTETERSVADMRNEVNEKRKLKVNEQHKKRVKRRIDGMTSQWRKRKRLCMDFLIAMEENTEGTITVKKCLTGDGQIDIDSDEKAIKDAAAFVRHKRSKRGRMAAGRHGRGTGGRAGRPAYRLPTQYGKARGGAGGLRGDAGNTVMANEDFIGVHLDSQGTVVRDFIENSEE